MGSPIRAALFALAASLDACVQAQYYTPAPTPEEDPFEGSQISYIIVATLFFCCLSCGLAVGRKRLTATRANAEIEAEGQVYASPLLCNGAPNVQDARGFNPALQFSSPRQPSSNRLASAPGQSASSQQDGPWDFFISHTQRSGLATTMASQLYADLRELGYSCWLDVRMADRSTSAMQDGIVRCKMVLAIITGPCENPHSPTDPKESNAYFAREYCLQELNWAREAETPIQPLISRDDKSMIGPFLAAAPEEFRDLRNTNFITMDRSDKATWDLNVKQVAEALQAAAGKQEAFGSGEYLCICEVDSAVNVRWQPTEMTRQTGTGNDPFDAVPGCIYSVVGLVLPGPGVPFTYLAVEIAAANALGYYPLDKGGADGPMFHKLPAEKPWVFEANANVALRLRPEETSKMSSSSRHINHIKQHTRVSVTDIVPGIGVDNQRRYLKLADGCGYCPLIKQDQYQWYGTGMNFTLRPDLVITFELPEGWEKRQASDGRLFYANARDQSTQWEAPALVPKEGRRVYE